MSRDYLLYLEDILHSCEKIARYIDRMDFDEFQRDERTYDAVIRNLEIIGEATRNIPAEVQQRNPQIEWRAIGNFRNIVAHEYFAIRDEIVWDIAQHQTPALLLQIQSILNKE